MSPLQNTKDFMAHRGFEDFKILILRVPEILKEFIEPETSQKSKGENPYPNIFRCYGL